MMPIVKRPGLGHTPGIHNDDEDDLPAGHVRLRLSMPALSAGGKWSASGSVGWNRPYKRTFSFGKGQSVVAVNLPGSFEGVLALSDHANVHKGALHFQTLSTLRCGQHGFDGALQWRADAIDGNEVHISVVTRQAQVRLYFTAGTALRAAKLRFEDSTPWREEKALIDGKLSCVLPPSFSGVVQLIAADGQSLATWKVHALGTASARLYSVQPAGVKLAHASKGTRVAEWHLDVASST
jgi:hypothetical protein